MTEPRLRVPRFRFRPWLTEVRFRMVVPSDSRRFKYGPPRARAQG